MKEISRNKQKFESTVEKALFRHKAD